MVADPSEEKVTAGGKPVGLATPSLAPAAAARNDHNHPKRIIVDALPGASREIHQIDKRLSYSRNDVGAYQQLDVYMDPTKAIGSNRTAGYIAGDFDDKKKKVEINHRVYFPVNGANLKTAGSVAEQQDVDDALQNAKRAAAELIAVAAETKGRIPVEFHAAASKTGHHLEDKVKTPHGDIAKVSHNQRLSELREQSYEKAVLDEVRRQNPAVIDRLDITRVTKGDEVLAVNTDKEHNSNRYAGMTVNLETTEAYHPYRVFHKDEKTVQYYVQNNESFRFNLNTHSGALEIPATAFERPLDVIVETPAENFQLLIQDKDGHKPTVFYKREKDGAVTVLADNKPVARLHYQEKAQVKEQDILVANVDATGDIKPAGRDVMGEQLKQQQRMAIMREIAGDDNIITKDELNAYNAQMARTQNLTVRDEWTAKSVDFIADRKNSKADRDRFLNDVARIGGDDGQGHVTVSKDQMQAARDKVATYQTMKDDIRNEVFNDLLAKGGFQLPASGSMQVNTVGNDAHSPTQTANAAGKPPAGRNL